MCVSIKPKLSISVQNQNLSPWSPRPCKMVLPNSEASFFTALPPRSVTQPQGLLTAQVSQACLGPLYLCLECPSPTWPAFSHSVLSSGTTSQRLFLTILPPQHSIPFSPHLFISLTRTWNYLAYYYCCLPVSLSLSDCSLLYPRELEPCLRYCRYVNKHSLNK